MKRLFLALALLAPVCVPGWLRRPSSQNCDWPTDPRSGPLDLAKFGDRNHLREDIETAEDQAVRFMDAQRDARGGPTQSSAVWNQCFVKLSSIIVAAHGLTPRLYNGVIGARPVAFDFAVGIGWALLYAWAAGAVAAKVRRKQSGTGAIIMMTYVSLAVAAAGDLLGDQWAGLWEGLRIGNGHLSYRVDRVPWGHHHVALFFAALAVFWLVAALRLRRAPASAGQQHSLALT